MRRLLGFRLRARLFSFAQRRDLWRQSLSWFWPLGRTFVWYTAAALLLTWLLQTASLRSQELWLTRPGVTIPDAAATGSLLVTLSQLGLVFLGLYFTAVSVVIGTASPADR